MAGANQRVAGGQFLLEYSASNLEVVSLGTGDFPFVLPVHFDACIAGMPKCTEEPPITCCHHGRIVYSIGVPSVQLATSEDRIMGRITFRVIGNGVPFVRFRRHGFLQNVLTTGSGSPIVPIVVDDSVKWADLHDYADFQNCRNGPATDAFNGCQCAFDANKDRDVDDEDYPVFLNTFLGPDPAKCP
jgi:hypothetical protein